jgi:hypothetical protein
MRSLFVFVMYVAPAIFLVYRAETYVDGQGRALLLARAMCIVLAVMIALVGLMRCLDVYGSDASSE